jgi:hypothetical protein
LVEESCSAERTDAAAIALTVAYRRKACMPVVGVNFPMAAPGKSASLL